jgi:hypothetical protein
MSMENAGKLAPTTPAESGEKNLRADFATRFKPGNNANPGGRPKGRHLSEALRENLDSLVPDGSKSYLQAIADRMCKTAAFSKRDSQATDAAEAIADRIEGKPTQGLRIEPPIDEAGAQRIADIYLRLSGEGGGSSSFAAFTLEKSAPKEDLLSQTTTLEKIE